LAAIGGTPPTVKFFPLTAIGTVGACLSGQPIIIVRGGGAWKFISREITIKKTTKLLETSIETKKLVYKPQTLFGPFDLGSGNGRALEGMQQGSHLKKNKVI
jgi:hypothetical protein